MTIKNKLIIAFGLIAIALFGRFSPHLWNMTPIVGVAILAGARLGWKWGIVIPISAMILSDFFIGFYSLPILISVYASFAIAGIIGYLVRKSNKIGMIVGGSLFSSMIFFFITNSAVWAFGTMYPHNLLGLFDSYFAGLPFFQNQVLGDLFFTTALFVVWELIAHLSQKLKLANV